MGYEATSDHYKILAINPNAGDSHNILIEILALKSGSWRRIGYPTVLNTLPTVSWTMVFRIGRNPLRLLHIE